MKFPIRINTPTVICFLLIAIASGYGWVLNLLAVINMDSFSGLMLVRAIGIFAAPLGAILGYVL